MSKTYIDESLPRVDAGERRSGVVWLVLAAMLWGTVGVSSALLNRITVVSPFVIGFLRLAFSAPFLLSLAYGSTRLHGFRIRRADMLLFGAMGLAVAAYQLFYLAAIPFAGVTLVTVVTLCSSPLIVALLSVFIFAERPTRRIYMALALAVPGLCVLVVGQGSTNAASQTPLIGIGLALGSGLVYATFAIMSKIATHRSVPGPQVVAIAFTTGAFLLFPAALLSGGLRLELPTGVWLIAAYMGIVPTGLAYILFVKGLRNATATVATVVTMLEPAVAALLSWLLLGEHLSPVALCGVGLLIGSVLVLSSGKRM